MARNRNTTQATRGALTHLQEKCLSLEIEISSLRNEIHALRNGAMALLMENVGLRRDVQVLRAELPTPQTVQEANNLIQGLLFMCERLEAEKRGRDSFLETVSVLPASSSASDQEQIMDCLAYLRDEPE